MLVLVVKGSFFFVYGKGLCDSGCVAGSRFIEVFPVAQLAFPFNEMRLVFLGETLVEGGGCCVGFLFFAHGLADGIELLDRRIEFEIQCRGNAELCQRMFHGRLHERVHDLFIFKFDLLFGGMNIDVYLLRVEVDKRAYIGKLSFGISSAKACISAWLRYPLLINRLLTKNTGRPLFWLFPVCRRNR